MTPPDISTREGRTAYRRELREIARKPRLLGFFLVLGGAALLAWPRMGGPWFLGDFKTQHLGGAALALGWVIWIWVIVVRTRYHKARMRGEQP